jgi:maleylpyruvate isomerase
VDETELRQVLDGLGASHAALVAWLDGLLAAEAIDPAAPSRLPDWTVGHVLTHLARNADSVVRALDGAARGEVVERYVGGAAGRNAEIAAGAGRAAAELVDDVRTTADAVERTCSDRTDWDGHTIEAHGGRLAVWALPLMRWREVEVHRVDLGLGYEPADWPALYLRVDLRALEMQWRATRPMGGLTGLPPAVLSCPPPIRLSWLLGRTEIDGVAPAGLY